MASPRLAGALALALLVAGCVTTEGGDPVDAASVEDAPAAADAAAGSTPAASDASPASALPNATRVVPFEFDGSLGAGAIACPMVTCVGESPGDRFVDLTIDGTLTAVGLTLTWDASAPVNEELRLGIRWGAEDDPQYAMVDGASPLVLTADGLRITSADDPLVFVWKPSVDPVGVAYAHSPQEFRVEGTLTVA